MSAKRRVLGRGLDSLIAPATDRSLDSAVATESGTVVSEISMTDLHANPNQPRFQFDDEPIAELAESIRQKGVLQPLLVRDTAAGYEIVAGERRWRAAQAAGLDKVPCIIIHASDEDSLEIALIENLQRQDLNPMEEARAYNALTQRFDLSQEAVAQRVGKARATVANSLRLLNLPLDIQEDVLGGRLTAGHARAILALDEPAKQRRLRDLVISKSLSVRQTEAQSRAMNRKHETSTPKPQVVQANMKSLQEAFSLKMGLPVFIKPVSDSSGKVEICYESLDDFEIISDFFGVDQT